MTNRINIFDFDGTIAESNILKTEAFRTVASSYGKEVSDWFVAYHKENGGVTRQKKIKNLCEKVDDIKSYKKLVQQYENILKKSWLQCPLIPGFESYIKNIEGRNIILSGGAKIEIEEYLAFNNFDAYFEEVFGNPIDKWENLDTIKEKYIEGRELYFYGDSKLDFELATSISANFIYVSKVSEWNVPIEMISKFHHVIEEY